MRELLRSSASEFVLQFLTQDAPLSDLHSRASSRAGSTRTSPVDGVAAVATDQTAHASRASSSRTASPLSAGPPWESTGTVDIGKHQRRRGGTGGGMETIGSQFRKQLSSLMSTIAATDTHYIRCVNPNNSKASQVLHQSRVVQQLRCSGLIQAIISQKSSVLCFFAGSIADSMGTDLREFVSGHSHDSLCVPHSLLIHRLEARVLGSFLLRCCQQRGSGFEGHMCCPASAVGTRTESAF